MGSLYYPVSSLCINDFLKIIMSLALEKPLAFLIQDGGAMCCISSHLISQLVYPLLEGGVIILVEFFASLLRRSQRMKLLLG